MHHLELTPPGGTIGHTFASGSITKSINTGPLMDRARSMAGSISASVANSDARDAIRLGQLLEVRGADAHLGVVLGVEEVLPLPHHTQVAVVDDGDD